MIWRKYRCWMHWMHPEVGYLAVTTGADEKL